MGECSYMLNKKKPYLENNLPEVLTDEEVEKYFKLAHNGDENAKKKLKEHNLRLVIYITKKFYNVIENNIMMDKEDLVSIGTIGLIKAVETFNIDKKTKFATYASICIENEILMAIRKNKNDKLNVSLDKEVGEPKRKENPALLKKLISEDSIEENYIKAETRKEVLEAIKKLNEVEQKVIMLRYGLNGSPLTQKQISEKIGYSRSYLSRIEKRALEKLSELLKNHKLFNYKTSLKEAEEYNNMNTDEKTIYLANAIIENKDTLKSLAQKLNISESAIRKRIYKKLIEINKELYDKVEVTLQTQKNTQRLKIKEKCDESFSHYNEFLNKNFDDNLERFLIKLPKEEENQNLGHSLTRKKKKNK